MIFKYIYRKNDENLVLIPGWAADYRVFTNLDLKFNYLIPVSFSPFTFEKDLLQALQKNNLKRVSLLGWSLGGFVAARFASRHKDLIDKVFLISIRRKYKIEELAEIKKYLLKNKKAYLRKFYRHCFSHGEEEPAFISNLFKVYSEELNLDYLIETLDYLGNTEINSCLLEGISRIKIIHGRDDAIAPFGEAETIVNDFPHAEFIIFENTGHLPFLREDFSGRIESDK